MNGCRACNGLRCDCRANMVRRTSSSDGMNRCTACYGPSRVFLTCESPNTNSMQSYPTNNRWGETVVLCVDCINAMSKQSRIP